MANIFNDDFRDFIKALNDSKVEYLLVGGYSVIIHGYSRNTGDMDLWVKPTSENYSKLKKAFDIFGMPVFDMVLSKFLDTANFDVFTFGRSPSSIEILTKVKGLNFEEAYSQSIFYEDEDLIIRLIHFDDLIKAKKAAGRARDLNDLEQLKKKNK
jgi:hypothetical protein